MPAPGSASARRVLLPALLLLCPALLIGCPRARPAPDTVAQAASSSSVAFAASPARLSVPAVDAAAPVITSTLATSDAGVTPDEDDGSGGDRPGDPCKYPGPQAGSRCTEPETVCLQEGQAGFFETICVRQRWLLQKAKPWKRTPHRACPRTPPMRGAACHGEGECAYSACMITDDAGAPLGIQAFYPRWVCYQGGWRRYDERCIGE